MAPMARSLWSCVAMLLTAEICSSLHFFSSATAHRVTNSSSQLSRRAFPPALNFTQPAGFDDEWPWKKVPENFPRIQKYPAPQDNEVERKTQLRRQRRIKRAFLHSWMAFKNRHSPTTDEIDPLTGKDKPAVFGWGATAIDAMDTMWMMNLTSEWKGAIEALKRMNPERVANDTVDVHEVNVRMVGGLLSMWELTGKPFEYEMLFNIAQKLAYTLFGAFNTYNRLPIIQFEWEE